MEPIITDNLEAIGRLCRKYHVRRMWVFGSAAGQGIDGNAFGPRSDIDLLAEFEKEYVSSHPFDLFYLTDEPEALFLRKVDMIEVQAMRKPYFIEAIEQQKQLVYAA